MGSLHVGGIDSTHYAVLIRPGDPSNGRHQVGSLHSQNAVPHLKELTAASSEGVARASREAIGRIETWASWANGFETIFRGISLSSILLIMSLGLAIVFGLMGVINMAHGELMMVGAYATFVTQELFKGYVSPNCLIITFSSPYPCPSLPPAYWAGTGGDGDSISIRAAARNDVGDLGRQPGVDPGRARLFR